MDGDLSKFRENIDREMNGILNNYDAVRGIRSQARTIEIVRMHDEERKKNKSVEGIDTELGGELGEKV